MPLRPALYPKTRQPGVSTWLGPAPFAHNGTGALPSPFSSTLCASPFSAFSGDTSPLPPSARRFSPPSTRARLVAGDSTAPLLLSLPPPPPTRTCPSSSAESTESLREPCLSLSACLEWRPSLSFLSFLSFLLFLDFFLSWKMHRFGQGNGMGRWN